MTRLDRNGQIARDQMRHQADVGQTLDVGVAAQRIHAAATHAITPTDTSAAA